MTGEAITKREAFNDTTNVNVQKMGALGEAFGKTVTWDGATASVYIGQKLGETQYMTDVLPAYESGAEGLYKEYSAIKSGGTESFSMAGTKYLDGFVFVSAGHFPERDWAVYNLNGQYRTFSAVLSHVDGTTTYNHREPNSKIQIFLDGVLKPEYEIDVDMPPKNVSFDVIGANQLKIVWSTGSWVNGTNTYGFGNPVLS